MLPLIDGDILLYELGYAAEAYWKYEGREGIPPFSFVGDMADTRIAEICSAVEATEQPILFFTGKTNFRNRIAKRQQYKEREGRKPFHYYNLRAYLKGKYDCRTEEGYEADDLMAIEQTNRLVLIEEQKQNIVHSIICTRDKDLHSVRGWQYGWEVHNQPSFGPLFIESFGSIKLSSNRKKVEGTGFLFFASQLLTGDSVDTIPGIDGFGPVSAFKTLEGCTTKKEALQAVLKEYKKAFGIQGYSEMIEQGRLLWMLRSYDILPIRWNT